MERRKATAISLSNREKALAIECSKQIGASVSQIFRIALFEYASNHSEKAVLQGGSSNEKSER